MNKTIHCSIAIITISLLCVLLIGCSKNQPLPLIIHNQPSSNRFNRHQSLPLDIVVYSTLHKKSLAQSQDDFHHFWSRTDNSHLPQTKQVGSYTVIPGSSQNHLLMIPAQHRFIKLFARFHNPQNKIWNLTLNLPHNIAWQQYSLYVGINSKGMHATFRAKDWLSKQE